jgi:hypothetical protein
MTLTAIRPAPLMDELASAMERMIAIQVTAYPDCWSDDDRREMAIHHLFPELEREEL